MPGFTCKHCGFDLSLRLDLLAMAIKSGYAENGLPTELSVDGVCDNCGTFFTLEGPMFTYFIKSKVEEEVISPDVENYAILEFDVSDEDMELFQRLLEEDDKEKLSEFFRRLMLGSPER